MNHTLQQVPGSAIGNLISPVLARFSPTFQLATWNISGAHSHKSNHYYNNFLTVSILLDTLTTDLFSSTNHNNAVQTSSTFSQTLSMNLQFYLNKNQTYPFLVAQSILIVRHYLAYNQPSASAASKQHKLSLSAAFSRICLAARHSYPRKQAKHDVESLIRRYVSLGYPEKPLRAKASQMLRHIY